MLLRSSPIISGGTGTVLALAWGATRSIRRVLTSLWAKPSRLLPCCMVWYASLVTGSLMSLVGDHLFQPIQTKNVAWTQKKGALGPPLGCLSPVIRRRSTS